MDVLPVAMCGSVIVLTLEVALLLAMADGMVPLSTPCRIASLWMLDASVDDDEQYSCSSTWQVGRAMDRME